MGADWKEKEVQVSEKVSKDEEKQLKTLLSRLKELDKELFWKWNESEIDVAIKNSEKLASIQVKINILTALLTPFEKQLKDKKESKLVDKSDDNGNSEYGLIKKEIVTLWESRSSDKFREISEKIEFLSPSEFSKLQKDAWLVLKLKKAYSSLKHWTFVFESKTAIWRLLWSEKLEDSKKQERWFDNDLLKLFWINDVEKAKAFREGFLLTSLEMDEVSARNLFDSTLSNMWINQKLSTEQKDLLISRMKWTDNVSKNLDVWLAQNVVSLKLKDLKVSSSQIENIRKNISKENLESSCESLLEIAENDKELYKEVMSVISYLIETNSHLESNETLINRIKHLQKTKWDYSKNSKEENDALLKKVTGFKKEQNAIESKYSNKNKGYKLIWENTSNYVSTNISLVWNLVWKDKISNIYKEFNEISSISNESWIKAVNINIDNIPKNWVNNISEFNKVFNWFEEKRKNSNINLNESEVLLEKSIEENKKDTLSSFKTVERDSINYNEFVAKTDPDNWQPLNPNDFKYLPKEVVEARNIKIAQSLNNNPSYKGYPLSNVTDKTYIPDWLKVQVWNETKVYYNWANSNKMLMNTQANKEWKIGITYYDKDWNEIWEMNVTQEESEILKKDIYVAESVRDFKEFFEDLKMPSIWKYRKELMLAIWNVNINYISSEDRKLQIWNKILQIVYWRKDFTEYKDLSSVKQKLMEFNKTRSWWMNDNWKDYFETWLENAWYIDEQTWTFNLSTLQDDMKKSNWGWLINIWAQEIEWMKNKA